MPLTAAFQMDHIRGLNIAGDTTFALMLEAQWRGHALLHYTPDKLFLRDGTVLARMEPVRVEDRSRPWHACCYCGVLSSRPK